MKVNKLEETVKELKEENDKLKAADTSISLYENKFQEMNAKDQKMQTTLKQNRDTIEEHMIVN